MFGLHSTLLTLNVAVGSVLVAVLYFYVQFVSTQYSYRLATRLVWSSATAFFTAAWLIAVTLSGLGTLASGLAEGDWGLSAASFDLCALTGNGWYGWSEAILTVLTVLAFVVATDHYARTSRSEGVLRALKKAADIDDFALYCKNRFGIPEAHYYAAAIRTLDARATQPETSQSAQASGLGDFRDQEDLEAYVAEATRQERRAIEAAERAGTLLDPLAPFIEVAATAIGEHDLPTFRQAITAFGEVCEGWIGSGALIRHAPDAWHPDMHLLHGFSRVVVMHCRFLDEACAAAGHPSLRLELIALIEKIAESAAAASGHSHLSVDLVYLLRDVASQALDSEAWRLFRDCVTALATIGTARETITPDEEPEEFMQASRGVGWLAERVACAKLPTKPMMFDYETDDPLEAIENALSRLSDWAERSPGTQGWSVIMDANGCFADRLLAHQLQHEHIETHLIHACGNIARLGKEGAKAGKENRAWRAGHTLQRLHEATHGTDLEWRELLDDFASWLLDLATWTRSVKSDGSMAGLNVLDDLLGCVQTMDRDAVESAVHELNVHDRRYGDETGATVWELIKELGHRMNTNFELNFDPVTKSNGWGDDLDDEDDGR